MQDLDFVTLNKAYKGETWCDTFAYWLLVLDEPQNVHAREAEEACAVMSFQYDVEDQAQNPDMLIGFPELIPAVFTPIAPVTLAFQWSPFPTAIKALGEPLHVDIHKGAALATFTPVIRNSGVGLSLDDTDI